MTSDYLQGLATVANAVGLSPKALAIMGIIQLQKELVRAYVSHPAFTNAEKLTMISRAQVARKVCTDIASGEIS